MVATLRSRAYFELIFGLMMCSMMCPTMALDIESNVLVERFLNQDPDPAEPGEYLELRWKVEKYGNSVMEGITYTLDIDYPFYFDSSDNPTKFLGNWQGFSDKDEYYTLYYKILVDENALGGNYNVRLRLNTTSGNAEAIKGYTIRVGEKTSPEFVIGLLTTSPKKLSGDIDEAEISVEIANIGDEDAQNVVLEVEFPEGFEPSYSYSDRAVLGTIEDGSAKTATFYVDIDRLVEAKVHLAELKITYKEANDDKNELKTISLPLELPIMEKPLLDIKKVWTVPETILPGDSVEIWLEIENSGGKEAESVSIRGFKDSSQPFDFSEKSDFIGRLKKGESSEAMLKIDVDSDAPGKNYLIDIEIRAISGAEVILEKKTISFHISDRNREMPGLISSKLLYILAGIAILFFIIHSVFPDIFNMKSSKNQRSSKIKK
jgi:hypothetical protein